MRFLLLCSSSRQCALWQAGTDLSEGGKVCFFYKVGTSSERWLMQGVHGLWVDGGCGVLAGFLPFRSSSSSSSSSQCALWQAGADLSAGEEVCFFCKVGTVQQQAFTTAK
jgi:uncharacterized protein YneR